MKKLFTLFLAMGLGLSLSAQVFINEGFEGSGIPAGWSNITNATDGGWKVGTASSLSSAYWPIPEFGTGKIAATNDDDCNCDKSNDIFVLPAIDASSVTALRIEFDAFFAGLAYQGITEKAYVMYSLDGGANWVVALQLTGSTDWQHVVVDLNALAGNSNALIGLKYDDGGSWLYGYAIDNLTVLKPFDNDVTLTLNPVSRYNLVNASLPMAGTITNNGLVPVTSLDISWTDGTNTYTDNLTGLNIAPGGTYNFTHSTAFDVAAAVSYDIEVTASNPNGQADGFPDNNAAAVKVSGLSFVPTVKMVAEEATGTWCGWCPRGFVFMSYMEETYEDFIGIAVHNGDPMENATYDGGLTSFEGFSGFPSVIVDRREVIDPSALESYYGTISSRTVPVAASIVDALIDPATGELTVTCDAVFATQLDASEYRLNLVLVENGVTGTGSGYNQVNYYGGGSAGQMGGWETLPNPVPASQMVYDEVARDILEGWGGVAGTADVNADDVVSKTWTYQVPSNWNWENMYVVFMVIENATGEILNADERYLWTVSTEEINNLQRFVLSPNPTTGLATLDLQLGQAADVRVELVNMMGQTLSMQQLDNSYGQQFSFDLSKQAAGTYFVKVTVGDQVRVERLVVAK